MCLNPKVIKNMREEKQNAEFHSFQWANSGKTEIIHYSTKINSAFRHAAASVRSDLKLTT